MLYFLGLTLMSLIMMIKNVSSILGVNGDCLKMDVFGGLLVLGIMCILICLMIALSLLWSL